MSKIFTRGTMQLAALADVSLCLAPTGLTAITGPSGSGKSTLLHVAAGLEQATTGTVLFDGQPLAGQSDAERARFRRRTLGFVVQHHDLLPALSALENIYLPLILDGVRHKLATRRAYQQLERVGLEARAEHLPEQLSGGELQRVAMARALVAQPAWIIADEPTGSLDSAAGAQILDLLTSAASDDGCAVLLATHDPAASARAARTIKLRDGTVVEDSAA